MDTRRILTELLAERERIDQAIAALQALDSTYTPPAQPSSTKAATPQTRGRRMSAAGRKRISEAAKKRWAERKKAAESPVTAKQSATKHSSKRRGGITAAGRKRISDMMKKRWAERRKAAGKA
jgi:hypothetical protein